MPKKPKKTPPQPPKKLKHKVRTGKKSKLTDSMAHRIQDFLDNGGLGNRKADFAFIKPVPKTDKLWHTSKSDRKLHLTVEFRYKGKHVTTKHVYPT
ncbi:hypothetical protein PRZ48_012482 [Zasmidium cellare]|uniref:Uncharacterized protein n=1 Tax=Zasmidium cellare TaxID=395010 RepID=A0ABR0E4Z4_ZASCE|nr:hypothetical protein PRZ48_012482 [Zasmidium cellare]